MDDIDDRLRQRLGRLADAVPTSSHRPASARVARPTMLFAPGTSPIVATLGLVLVTTVAIAIVGRMENSSSSPVASSGPVASASPSPSARVATGFRGLPIDKSLTAVSPDDPAVAVALDLCVRADQRSLVVGMARMPAREVHRFMLSNGKEPELATDELIWAIQLQGDVLISTRAPSGSTLVVDPLCVVIAGRGLTYAPYGHEGTPFSPPPDFVWPEVALPPLLPSSSVSGEPSVACDRTTPMWTQVGPNGSQVPIPVALTCENAVAAAKALVGADPAIVNVEFHFGTWCPPGALCTPTLPNQGYVIFRRSSPGPDIRVAVTANAAGSVTARDPQPLPSPSG
jgi:hypothetical protein